MKAKNVSDLIDFLKIGSKVRLENGAIATIVNIMNEPLSSKIVYLIDKPYKGENDEKYGYDRQYYQKETWFIYAGEILELIEVDD